MSLKKESVVNHEGEAVTYEDLNMRVRTLVHPDGSTLQVEKSTISTADPKWIDFIDKNPEFKRV